MMIQLRLLIAFLGLTTAAAGTQAQAPALVQDLTPGLTSSPSTMSNKMSVAYWNGSLYVLQGTTRGSELYRVPPTGEPVMVANLDIGPTAVDRVNIVAGTDYLYLFAEGAPLGTSVWRSDGTLAGTRTLPGVVERDGAAGWMFPSPGGGAYLITRENSAGVPPKLWRVRDDVGTTLINPAIELPEPGEELSKTLSETGWYYFVGRSETTGGRELFRANAISDAVEQVSIATTNVALGSPVAVLDDAVLVIGVESDPAGKELWRVDLQTGAASRVRDIRPGATGSDPLSFVEMNGQVFFSADDGVHGRELWRTDGTDAGTEMAFDIYPGPNAGCVRKSSSIVAVGGALFMVASTVIDGHVLSNELFRYDGGAQSPQLVTEINPDPNDSAIPSELVKVGDRLLFSTWIRHGAYSLWASDGTAVGTQRLLDGGVASDYRIDANAIAVNGEEFAFVRDYTGLDVWKSRGTSIDTSKVYPLPRQIGQWTIFGQVRAIGSNALAVVSSGSSTVRGLWMTNGASTGLTRMSQVGTATLDRMLLEWIPFDGGILFAGGNDRQLWRSNGTVLGTSLVYDLANRAASRPTRFRRVGNAVAFASSQTGISTEVLWRLDPGGQAPVMFFDPANHPYLTDVVSDGSMLTILGVPPQGTVRVWRSDATMAGTAELFVPPLNYTSRIAATPSRVYVQSSNPSGEVSGSWAIDPRSGESVPLQLPWFDSGGIIIGDSYFWAWGSDRLYRVDADEANAVAIHDAVNPFTLTKFGDRIIGTTWTDAGAEPFISDGTLQGTHIIKDIAPGRRSSDPTEFVVSGGRAYFSAFTPEYGYEPWVTDGTQAGTRMLADLEPGMRSSFPAKFAAGGDRVFFVATTSLTGSELWMVSNSGCAVDIDGNGAPGVGDLFAFLGHWFGHDADADWNNDGQVSLQDLFEFLAAWFTGC